MFYTCRFGHLEILKILVNNYIYLKDDFAHKSARHRNAFIVACEYNQLTVIQYMVKFLGFNEYKITNENNHNGFMLACRNGHYDVVKYLVENEHCPFTHFSAEDKSGYNAYTIAKEHKRNQIVKYLDASKKYHGIGNFIGVRE